MILIRSMEAVADVAKNVSPQAERLMRVFWPGSLTLIFEAVPELPEIVTGGTGRIGVRVSPDPVCKAILERFGKPLVSTSANPSGRKPAQHAQKVLDYFEGRVDLILDHGERTSAVPSTVLDVTGAVPLVIRKGPVGIEAIRNVVGEVLEKKSV